MAVQFLRKETCVILRAQTDRMTRRIGQTVVLSHTCSNQLSYVRPKSDDGTRTHDPVINIHVVGPVTAPKVCHRTSQVTVNTAIPSIPY